MPAASRSRTGSLWGVGEWAAGSGSTDVSRLRPMISGRALKCAAVRVSLPAVRRVRLTSLSVTLDAKNLRRNWWSEARIASIYAALAGVASEGAVRRRLEGLAADEDRHASAWAALASSAGVPVGSRRPWAAAFVLALLARVLGVGRVLGLAGIAEGRVLRSYLGQVVRDAEGDDQALLRALIPEETGHLEGSSGVRGPRARARTGARTARVAQARMLSTGPGWSRSGT